tara:strand:- start:1133 stop:1510 length:378 start_codon:yes stop_codon:yes gene_type:complete
MKRSFILIVLIHVLISFSGAVIFAQTIDERAHNLFKEVRCLVCQGQTIHESNAELAEDLKVIIKEQLTVGKSDDDIKKFLVDKYGDWILMTPPFDPYTYILWLSPVFILVFGFGYIYYKSRKELK